MVNSSTMVVRLIGWASKSSSWSPRLVGWKSVAQGYSAPGVFVLSSIGRRHRRCWWSSFVCRAVVGTWVKSSTMVVVTRWVCIGCAGLLSTWHVFVLVIKLVRSPPPSLGGCYVGCTWLSSAPGACAATAAQADVECTVGLGTSLHSMTSSANSVLVLRRTRCVTRCLVVESAILLITGRSFSMCCAVLCVCPYEALRDSEPSDDPAVVVSRVLDRLCHCPFEHTADQLHDD